MFECKKKEEKNGLLLDWDFETNVKNILQITAGVWPKLRLEFIFFVVIFIFKEREREKIWNMC